MILSTPTGSVALGPPAMAALHRIATDQQAGRRPNEAAFHAIALVPLYESGLVGCGAEGRLVLATMTAEDALAALDDAGYPVHPNCGPSVEPVCEPVFVESGFLLGVHKVAPHYLLARRADGSDGPLYDTYEWAPLGTMERPTFTHTVVDTSGPAVTISGPVPLVADEALKERQIGRNGPPVVELETDYISGPPLWRAFGWRFRRGNR